MANEEEMRVYTVGVVCASACTSLPDHRAEEELNHRYPTGVDPWTVSDDPYFADGESPNPSPCPDRPGTHRHVLFHC